ncbi:hypothetical protein DSAG12_00821 [Promethearchaeum syntrophicum]|uniref:Uncharacterized protein n=1 Tax=Promethearchaeum syntrophicum TaxID=2594042 RepID=A0A5B9D758_9ARCH|nr:hypothetical protein [Candidatus Prometheoarchaeum syntrophicum]QEE14998.1 hypothetical protein DSAG12_00821 [Candidatus Prometheoarchaeum syntrophicum]
MKNSPKTQEISKISYKQYQQYEKYLKKNLKSKKVYTNYSNQIRRYLRFHNPDFSKWYSDSHQQPILQNDHILIEKFIDNEFVRQSKSKELISKANLALKNYYKFLKIQNPDLNSIENAKNSQLNEFKTYLTENRKYSSDTIRKQKRIVQNFLQFNKLLEFQNKISNVKQYITKQIQKHADLSSMMTEILTQTPDAHKQSRITTCRRFIHDTFKKFPKIAEEFYDFDISPKTQIKIDTNGKVAFYIR